MIFVPYMLPHPTSPVITTDKRVKIAATGILEEMVKEKYIAYFIGFPAWEDHTWVVTLSAKTNINFRSDDIQLFSHL